jgi:hypothetical protein
MTDIYDNDRIFFPEDPELRVLGSIEKLAQWRHRNTGPAFIRIGRRIGYQAQHIQTIGTGCGRRRCKQCGR